jgi:OmpA-OmpF porin, OOP family
MRTAICPAQIAFKNQGETMKKIILAAALSAIAVPAIANDFYVGANVGTANYGYVNVPNNNQAAWSIFGGYQFSRLFSAEIEYAGLGGFDTSSRQYTGNSVAVKGVGTFPLGQKFALIG